MVTIGHCRMPVVLYAVQEVGYFIAFYRKPAGLSAGTLPAFHGERSPLRSFTGNRAHSNRRVSLSPLT